jgi:hypothetical protein
MNTIANPTSFGNIGFNNIPTLNDESNKEAALNWLN